MPLVVAVIGAQRTGVGGTATSGTFQRGALSVSSNATRRAAQGGVADGRWPRACAGDVVGAGVVGRGCAESGGADRGGRGVVEMGAEAGRQGVLWAGDESALDGGRAAGAERACTT
jgi:hypothetical protein